MKAINHKDGDPRNNEISNLEDDAMSDKPAIEQWKPPYSSQAYHMTSAIIERYRKLQEEEAAVSEYADTDDIYRIRRRLQDEWFHDVLLICNGALKYLTGIVEYYQKLAIERVNLSLDKSHEK